MIIDIDIDQNQKIAAAIMAADLFDSARAATKGGKRTDNAPLALHIAPGAITLICEILNQLSDATTPETLDAEELYRVQDWIGDELTATTHATEYSEEDRAAKTATLDEMARKITRMTTAA